MPFTASHIAAILPFWKQNKRYISQTGLIAGAIVPDFEYFFRMSRVSDVSHTWWGFLLFGLPVGLMLTYLWHNVARDPLIKNLPYFFQKRWRVYTGWSWERHFKKNWKPILLSLALGCLTHFLWDSFTHRTGFVVEAIPFLSEEAFANFAWYRLLQHGSTLLGATILVYAISKMPTEDKHIKPIIGRYWLSVFLITLIVFSARMLAGNIQPAIDFGTTIISLLSAGLIGLLLAPSFLPSKK
ncbi:MAG: DUF4184 family protein [Saprospiraceae bacterium]|nr:DUF4184 family protein [Saprospiraceae bacterium]